jgi:hypothetical protein
MSPTKKNLIKAGWWAGAIEGLNARAHSLLIMMVKAFRMFLRKSLGNRVNTKKNFALCIIISSLYRITKKAKKLFVR